MKKALLAVQVAAMNSTSKPTLKIDWATHEAAKFACLNWHYSECMPAGKIVKIGVWEDGKFIGVVLFSRGANNNLGSPYQLDQTQVCELTRIAMTRHKTAVSRVMSIAMKFLHKNSPGLRLIVSYADPLQGHHGGVYQAGGWVYTGASQAQCEVMHNGKVMHKRTANALFGTIKGMQKSPVMWKHKYLMPLDDAMRAKIAPLAKPYPKRVKKQDSEHPSELGGAVPTDTLQ
jgi:hypothetical protein